jgi:pimeloyl-ACP methyl ester carboxylesterase
MVRLILRRVAATLLLGGCAAPLVASHLPHPAPVVERPVQRARVNGVELAWDEFGEPHAPALLLIMGLGLQLIAWDDAFCAQLAARGFHVIRFDNRDVGLSTHLDAAGDPNVLDVVDQLRRKKDVHAAYALADLADDAAGLIEALGVVRAHVVGLSLGGMIGQELAIRHPDRVATLTSIMSTTGDPAVRGASLELTTQLVRPWPLDRRGFIERSVEVARLLRGGGFALDEEAARRLAARSYDRSPDMSGMHRQLVAILVSGSRRARLRTLQLPALVIHGDGDPLIPVDGGRDTAQAIAGSRLLVIPGLGHELPRAVWPRVIDAVAALAGAH